jgi:ParG
MGVSTCQLAQKSQRKACERMESCVNKRFDGLVVARRRDDPNYAQVSGYINKELAMRFKLACTAKEVSQTDALEEAVRLWLEKNEPPSLARGKRDE